MATERAELILSPAEKQMAQPLLRWLDGEHLKGKKELVVNKPGEVGFEAFDGTWQFMPAPDMTLDSLLSILNLLAERTGQTYSMLNPILSVKLPGGHRAQFVAGQQNARKFTLCVRLAQEHEFELSHYVMDDAERNALIEAIKGRKTILISGGTGTGKTSFMNACLKQVQLTDRLVVLEDVPELKIPHDNTCHFLFSNTGKGGVGINDLLNATLRLRPDRIIMGEIRKENAFTFCSAINTGHAGSMTTVHANNPAAAVDAVINRVMLNGDTTESALNILKRQLEGDVYGVAQLTRKGSHVHAEFKPLKH
ncbi:MAG TPA: ATPase, T2SS/T4P/T4SS family [Alphaproteobacteria bacterium]|nr:ATPase, T2SS/T4P/T4SS family [Alphaproteobacteria bacterium]